MDKGTEVNRPLIRHHILILPYFAQKCPLGESRVLGQASSLINSY